MNQPTLHGNLMAMVFSTQSTGESPGTAPGWHPQPLADGAAADAFATPGGLVDRETAGGPALSLWGDDAVVLRMADPRDTSFQRPRRHAPAA